ncbi:MAG: glucose-6-phosphate isomerase [Bacteroidetes bacterium]|nr:glucose-6-phosphate isomerase [Bacteroidota bacterium]
MSESKIFSVIPDAPEHLIGEGFNKDLTSVLSELDIEKVVSRIYQKDASLWSSDKAVQTKISDRLGWLDLPDDKKRKVQDIRTFAEEVKNEGFKYAVLLGMGGSSLCSEVARETFGTKRGYLKLHVLDDTDPQAIHAIEKKIVIDKTLFIVASKSGNTKESLSFFQYFYDLTKEKLKTKAGNNFIAITDKGTPLVALGKKYKFRKVFINPSDIGGRYSVLSDFGLVPMALIGVDIASFMYSALGMKTICSDAVAASNPGFNLGAEIAIAQLNGKDKLTFIISPSVAAFGYWVEQLIAESTGKDGKGIIPVNGEEIGAPHVYGDDRIFIYIHAARDDDAGTIKKINTLEKAGHVVIRIGIPDNIALGGEYYCWELATAVAGMIMGINPFDEPNVAESKKNTDDILTEWQAKKAFPATTPLLKTGNISIYTSEQTKEIRGEGESIYHFINTFLNLAQNGDYIALLPYFYKTDNRTKFLQDWRMQMRDELRVATTLLHGPRYLHSTGQLHKGGPNEGLYIILTADENEQLPIPEGKYGFDVLHRAQALGDFRSLSDKGRRVIRIDLGKDVDKGLKGLWEILKVKPKRK